MTVLYLILCYNEVCYKETVLYVIIIVNILSFCFQPTQQHLRQESCFSSPTFPSSFLTVIGTRI